jgi:putative methyltransferase (TIGR04325 family)
MFIGNRSQNLFLGVHATWDAAANRARSFGTAGYDNVSSARLYDDRVRMDPHDYPSLYWLTRSMHEGMRSVFDVGGAIGVKFIAFRDVSAMVRHGRELALQRDDGRQLHFTESFRDGDGCEVLFASGVLQYLPQRLGEMLSSFSRLPQRIVINTAAIHPRTEFFTVNSIGTAFCPYRVQTQAELIRGLVGLGYRVRESWINPGKLMTIPFHPELSLDHYSGYCLDRAG